MSKTNVLTLQDLVEQGYTPDQIVNLIAGIQASQEKAKAEAEAKAKAEKEAAARKTLIASWYAYCDTIGWAIEDASDEKCRKDLIEAIIDSANLAANPNPTEANVEAWLTGLLNKVCH